MSLKSSHPLKSTLWHEDFRGKTAWKLAKTENSFIAPGGRRITCCWITGVWLTAATARHISAVSCCRTDIYSHISSRKLSEINFTHSHLLKALHEREGGEKKLKSGQIKIQKQQLEENYSCSIMQTHTRTLLYRTQCFHTRRGCDLTEGGICAAKTTSGWHCFLAEEPGGLSAAQKQWCGGGLTWVWCHAVTSTGTFLQLLKKTAV